MIAILRLLGWLRSDRGLSLPETAIAGMLLMAVLAITSGLLHSGQTVVQRETERSINNDQIRLAVEQLDREIRSGNLVYPPGPDEPRPSSEYPYLTLRVFTQVNQVPRCVQWLVAKSGRLLRRSWAPAFGHPDAALATPEPTGWRVVAEGLVNDQFPVGDQRRRVFEAAQQNRTVSVRLFVNESFDERPGQTIELRSSITGRNTVTTFPLEACEPSPDLGDPD